ncbi:MAG TPA: C45 family autoproteolytic acyltransferase/hydrolase, partial [Bacteroidia bacterium]|nr:C45 family autoproteolytic acyltransferase/hydrolase [Bacteroidia bacterium]
LPEFVLEWRPLEDGLGDLVLTVPGQAAVGLRVEAFLARETALAASTWTPSDEVLEVADRVALSHLVRCAEVLGKQIGAKTPPLPEATGRRELVATSGKGRLENHDGVRVLFLTGTPEEMGRQQGELLREEVRAVGERILYGVGVGSSFAKGRWFFGEIEEAQGRIEPFTSEAHLREMDAIAETVGVHRQESRLANFFPELFHCSGFALHGTATADGQIYHGRILDYIRGAGLEDNAVVMVCRPDGGNAWVNVSYAGFVGSVTAMNEKQLAIGEMGGRGEGNWDGKPMAQLVREVMERCDTIDEAVEWMRQGPRTCEYYYVVSDAKSGRAVGIKATPEIFETVWSGESHPQLPDAVADTVLLSAGDRYTELVRRVKEGFGRFDADSARELMTRPVCMKSNIQSVLFAPGSLDFWVANADSENVASHTRYTHFNLAALLGGEGTEDSAP